MMRVVYGLSAVLQNIQVTRPEVRKVLANTSWLFIDRMIRIVVDLFVVSRIARFLGPEQNGILSFGASFVMLFFPVISLGLESILVREIVKAPNDRDEILGTAFWLRLVSGLLCLPLIVLLSALIQPDDQLMRLVVLIYAIAALFNAFSVIDFWFQSQVSSRYVVYARNASYIIVTMLRLACLALQAPLLAFAVIALVDSILLTAGLVLMYRRHGSTLLRWRFTQRQARSFLRTAWPIILEGIAIIMYMRIDQTMLGLLIPGEAGKSAVGIYAVAVRISEIWLFVPLAILSSVFPAIVKSREIDRVLYLARTQRLFRLMALISYLVALPVTFAAPSIIHVLFGPEYQAAAPILVVLIWTGMWVTLGSVRGYIIQAEDLMSISLWSSLLGALLNLLLNLILIPPLLGLGSAIASFVSYGVQAYVCSFLFPKLREFGKMQTRALLFPNPVKRAN